MQLSIPKYNFIKCYTILLVITLFFVSDDTVTFGTNENQILILLKYGIYVLWVSCSFLILALTNKSKTFNLYHLFLIIAVFSTYLAAMVFNLDFRNGYLLQALVMLLALLFVKVISIHVFFYYYNKILVYLALISLFVFLLIVIYHPIVDYMPTTTNYGGVQFGNILICAVFKSTEIIRNTSIFREPGVYANYLLAGIILQLFYRAKANMKHVVLFILCLITTLSTSGFLILAILIFAYMLKAKNLILKFWTFVVIVIVVLAAYMLPDFYSLVFSKFSEDSNDYASALSRISSFSVPWVIFLNYPVFGAGLSQFSSVYEFYAYQLFGVSISAEDSSTNTILNSFAIFGLFYGTIIVVSLVRFSKFIGSRLIITIMVFIAIFLMFSNQEMRFSLFFNVLIMYGLFLKFNQSKPTKAVL